jgi:predicted DNA-binding transcriptional regulator AlpA
MHITDPLLTAREGAAFLQISVPTFWRRVANGTIPPAIRLGGLSRWPLVRDRRAVIEQAKARRDQPHNTTSETEVSDNPLSGRGHVHDGHLF